MAKQEFKLESLWHQTKAISPKVLLSVYSVAPYLTSYASKQNKYIKC